MRYLLCCLMALGCGLAQPRIERAEQRVTLANSHLSLSLDLLRGGWIDRLAGSDGRVYAQGGQVYTDWGLFAPRGLVGTPAQSRVAVTETARDGRRWVAVTGAFAAAAAVDPAADTLTYRLRYGLGDGPDLAVEVALTPGVAMTGSPAFLAAVTNLPGLSEWLAHTVDGRINERISREGRVFESSHTPLDPDLRELGLIYTDGRRMVVSAIEGEGCPLHNVFIHAGAGGGGALFIGLLDGDSPGWPAGQTWRARWSMRLEP